MITEKRVVLVVKNEYTMNDINYEAIEKIDEASIHVSLYQSSFLERNILFHFAMKMDLNVENLFQRKKLIHLKNDAFCVPLQHILAKMEKGLSHCFYSIKQQMKLMT